MHCDLCWDRNSEGKWIESLILVIYSELMIVTAVTVALIKSLMERVLLMHLVYKFILHMFLCINFH
jgi:hypothetical protein